MSALQRRIALGMIAAGALVAVVLFQQTGTIAGPREDLKPIASWTFDAQSVKNGKVADGLGKLEGTLQGKPKWIDKPTAAIEFANPDEYALVKKGVTPKSEFLPKKEFSIVAWVRIDESTEWGGIFGCLQHNGPKQKGFWFGFDKKNFAFGLATEGTDTGDGKITYLKGTTGYELGKWYHIAATYDGKSMKLFVNGKADGESKEQSGNVLYAASANLVIGRYQDDNEDYPMQGAIKEVLWTDTAATPEQLKAHFQADEKLIELKASVAGPKFVVEPYLQFGTKTSMIVMAETDVPTTAELKYGSTYPPKESITIEKASVMHEIKIEKLQPKTKYFYTLTVTGEVGQSRTGKPMQFGTAVETNDAYSFCVVGDTQRNPDVTGKIAKSMWERRPNFVLHMGDVVDDGAAKWQWTGDLFKPCSELFGRVVVYPCIGNHEKNHADYYKYFSLPTPEYYYTFGYGNADFFSLDTNKSVAPESEQYKWLDKALAASTAKWKICYHHHPCYSNDSDDYGDTWKGNTTFGQAKHKHLIALYEKHNVDLAMNGHIHLYERSHPIRAGKVDSKSGVTYVGSGGGGGGLEDFDPVPSFFKNQGLVAFHYCYYTVVGGSLECRVFDVEGRLFDQFSMKKE